MRKQGLIIRDVSDTVSQSYHLELSSCRGIMQQYEIILYRGNEDKVFVAKVPELPGSMAHRKTPEKASKNVDQAIELCIDTAKEFGDSIPEPKGRRLMLA